MLKFTEDDVLSNGRDPSYPGISGWWKEQFNSDFTTDYNAAVETEKDYGDSFERLVTIQGKVLRVTCSFDGYSAQQVY